MRKLILILTLFPFLSFAQITPEYFGAKGNGTVDDQPAIQKAIDSAVKTSTGVFLGGKMYRIDRPLIVYNWKGTQYGQATIFIRGSARMWDNGAWSTIRASYDSSFVLGIQIGKGCIIEGVKLSAVRQGRNSRFSPQAAVVIDPFSGIIPADGGYPMVREFYRGPQSRTGSTGIRVQDCTFENVTAGVITSPNGYTQNSELLTFENNRWTNCRYGIIGCQAQEKNNRVINAACWSKMDCFFVFNKYGAQQPGNWFVDGMNIAGSVDSLIHRSSVGWGPMYMQNVFAESLQTIGYWYAGSGDVLDKSFINLRYPSATNPLPGSAIDGRDLVIRDCNIRYYGMMGLPISLLRTKVQGGKYYVPPVQGERFSTDITQGYALEDNFELCNDSVINNTVILTLKKGSVTPGQLIVFVGKEIPTPMGNGQGLIESVDSNKVTVTRISKNLKTLTGFTPRAYKRL